MSSSTADINSDDFIIAVSVLGGSIAILLVLIVALFLWIYRLSKKIKEQDPLGIFKLRRPKVKNHQESQNNYNPQYPFEPKPDYDNLVFVNDEKHQSKTKNKTPSAGHHEHRDFLNPIALRSKSSIDNSNFSFGNNLPLHSSNIDKNSFRHPHNVDIDSKYY